MKLWAVFGGVGLIASMSLGQAVRLNNDQGDGIEQTYNVSYSRSHEISFTGTVSGKIKGDPKNGIAESIAILVKTGRGKTYSVDLGPTWYVADQATQLKIGDKIKVTGEPVTMKNSSQDVDKFVLARQIVKRHSVLSLRDSSGYPYWSAYRKGRYAVNGASNSLTGKIVSQNSVNAENQQQVGYQVQTENGMVNVAVAPNWYLEQQGLGFHVGDTITVYTGAGPSSFGNHIVLADGLYGNDGTVVLRPNGVPAWQGWTGGNSSY